MSNAYKTEMDAINPDRRANEFGAKMKFSDSNGGTKWMQVNDESALEVAKWLVVNFPGIRKDIGNFIPAK